MSSKAAAMKAVAIEWDLANDWSNTNNANGVWTYREGSNALPWVPYIGAPLTPFQQGAWGGSGSVGTFLPLWAKLEGNPIYDLQTGDVFMHSTDSANGRGHGVGNVIWTSPIDGTLNISGNTWMARDIGRSNQWSLYLNGGLLSSGNISSGDPYSHSNPFDFANGSGGSSVLENIAVSTGDVIQLNIARTSGAGDFAGVNLNIAVAPEPISSTLFIVGGATLGFRRFRKKLKIASHDN